MSSRLSQLMSQLDKLYEYDREPVVPAQFKPISQFAGLLAGVNRQMDPGRMAFEAAGIAVCIAVDNPRRKGRPGRAAEMDIERAKLCLI